MSSEATNSAGEGEPFVARESTDGGPEAGGTDQGHLAGSMRILWAPRLLCQPLRTALWLFFGKAQGS